MTGVYSDETLKAWKESRKGRPGYFKGHNHSEDTINRLREISNNHPNRKGPKGQPWSSARLQAQKDRNGKPYKRGEHRRRFKNMVTRRANKPILKNGKKYHPLWHEIRKLVYKRDNYKCQECGVHCQVKAKKKIQCHHIDYDVASNDLSNLITLCASCHAKTNFRRGDWIIHYSQNQKG